MRSIRNQLAVWLITAMLLLMAAAAIGLYGYMDDVLEDSLDAALASKADAIIAGVYLEDGQPCVQPPAGPNPIQSHHEDQFYFQIWKSDGSTLVRVVSTAMGAAALPHVSKPHRRFMDARLSDGTRARIFQRSFTARMEEGESDSAHKATAPAAQLVLVVAHDRRSIEVPLAILLSGLGAAAVIISAGIVLVITWGVRRGLRPLSDVSAMADRIGPETLDVRFPVGDCLPQELLPIGLKLNELLNRLGAAFARERRFSAAVAHELRTPLAELRTACDVALRWPDDAQGLSIALSETRDVAIQMSVMVQSLLSLARRHAGLDLASRAEQIHLATAVTAALPQAPAARDLKIETEVDASVFVHTDPALLAAALRNLLQNAIDHTPPGGSILIRCNADRDRPCVLQITNSCQEITPADIPQLFEPFWRKDASRTGTHHAGLGLTLVHAYCQAMEVGLKAELIQSDKLAMTLTFTRMDV